LGSSKEDHIEKARENHNFAETFDLYSWTKREWGVHYLQAYLSTKNARTSTHSETRKRMRSMPELHDLADDYNQLYNMSWNARYTTLPCRQDDVLKANDLLLAIITHIQKLMPF